jgi:hypothetical protein
MLLLSQADGTLAAETKVTRAEAGDGLDAVQVVANGSR